MAVATLESGARERRANGTLAVDGGRRRAGGVCLETTTRCPAAPQRWRGRRCSTVARRVTATCTRRWASTARMGQGTATARRPGLGYAPATRWLPRHSRGRVGHRDEAGQRGVSILAQLREPADVHAASRVGGAARRRHLALGGARSGRDEGRVGRADHQRGRQQGDRVAVARRLDDLNRGLGELS